MKHLLILIILITSLQADTKLVGYLPAYRNLDVEKVQLLTDLIIFSIEPQKNGQLKKDENVLKLLEKIKGINNCRKFICVGGWGKSENFKHVTLDPNVRKRFINTIEKLVKYYELDGVDYDWEHPKSKEEEKAYEMLIKETAEKGIKVSVAAAAWQKFTPEVFKHIFALNLMSYDHPEEHSTVKSAEQDIKDFIKMGCPAEKINLGVPFYGRHIKNRKAKSFNTLKINDSKTDIIDGYYFNNIETLKKKAGLVKAGKLSGIMIWEIEQDDKDLSLLKTLRKALKE